MKETELNKVLNYMKQYVENKYEHDSEPMLTYKDLQLVLEEIERLNNIIKEAIDYLESYNTDFKNCRFGEAPISMRELGDLLDILKGIDK